MAALRPPMFALAALAALALVGHAHVADAARIYRWTDSNGVSHYGDRAPDKPRAQVKVIRAHVEPTAIARLRLQNQGAHNLAWVDN